MSDPYLSMQRQIQALEEKLEVLRKADSTLLLQSTYTPTYLGGSTAGATTYSIQQGSYVRIGQMIIASGTVAWTASTGTGNAQISLPFTSSATTNVNATGVCVFAGVTFTNGTPTALVTPSTAFFTLNSPITNGASATVQMEAAGTIIFTVVYLID